MHLLGVSASAAANLEHALACYILGDDGVKEPLVIDSVR